jgi:release factor glutamine methyltransferase
MATVSHLLQLSNRLRSISDSPRLDCELLLCHVLEVDRTWLRTWPDKQVLPDRQHAFERLLQKRVQGYPIAYLIGSRGFWSMDLNVSAQTLIPRPETELLVEIALSLELSRHSLVLDLGTGTGAIALALATECQDWQITAIDHQRGAVALAKQNCQQQELSNVQIFQSDWFSAIDADATRFDLIVSNPPYVSRDDPHLRQGDVRFEPSTALVSGEDGLDDLKLIVRQSPNYLQTNGWLLVEHGYDQGEAVRNLFDNSGFSQVTTCSDYNNLDRVTYGQWRK